MTFEERLKEWNGGIFRGAVKKFAAKIGVSASAVSNWIGGMTPGEEMLAKIARELGTSADQAATYFGHKQAAPTPSGIELTSLSILETTAPVLGVVTADRFAFSFDAVPDEHIPNPWPRKRVFALRISGDCMEPTFRDGEFVFISETQQIVDGRVVLAFLDGEFTLKRYYKRADGIELKPDNPKYKPIKVASKFLVIKGVVVGTYRRDI